MVQLIDYKGFSVLDTPPIGPAGLAWDRNFRYAADRLYNLAIDVTAPQWGLDATNWNLDAAAGVQNAANALIEQGGGVLFLPGTRYYSFASTVIFAARVPILVRMDSGPGGIIGGMATGIPAPRGFIKPIANLPNGFFKWQKSPLDSNPIAAGGGGAVGLVFDDPTNRTFDVHSGLNITEAGFFYAERCNFYRLKGRAVYGDWGGPATFYNCDTRHCGDTNKPAWQLGDVTGTFFAELFACRFEQNQDADVVRITGVGSSGFANGANLYSCGFEQETSIPAQAQIMINALGGVNIDNRCTFSRSNMTQVAINWPFSMVANSAFSSGSSLTLPNVTVAAAAVQTKLRNLDLFGGGNAQDVAIQVNAARATLSDIELYATGGIDTVNASRSRLRNISVISCKASAGRYMLDIGNCSLKGATINSVDSPVGLHAIRTSTGKVRGSDVFELNNANGIVMTNAAACVQDNSVENIGTGTAFTYVSGAKASGNRGYPTAANSVSDGNGFSSTVTLNAESGVINCVNLGTIVGGGHLVVLNNSLIAGNSHISWSVGRGTDGGSGRYRKLETSPTTGVCVFTWYNDGAGAVNGTVLLSFRVENH